MRSEPAGNALLPPEQMARLNGLFPASLVVLAANGGTVQVRQMGQGPTLVCLHGIGSMSASFFELALALKDHFHILAWDAPGYGASSALPQEAPSAAQYAARLLQVLDALQIDEFTLLGHSLGAIIAGAACKNAPLARRIRHLVLLSAAQGYGAPQWQDKREQVRAQRLDGLKRLGIAAMAEQRSTHLLAAHASDLHRQWVRWCMAQLNPQGYEQAIHLLCSGDLMADLPPAMPVTVACGTLDQITTPQSCAQVARRCGAELQLIERAAHACYVERAQSVADLLLKSCFPASFKHND